MVPVLRPRVFSLHSRRITAPSRDVIPHDVLILSSDPLAAALLGAAVELAGHAPAFSQEGESARAALLRVRPRVALLDCDHEESCSEAFVGPALMTGARVVLFRSHRTRSDMVFAERMGLTVLTMPNGVEEVARLLDGLDHG